MGPPAFCDPSRSENYTISLHTLRLESQLETSMNTPSNENITAISVTHVEAHGPLSEELLKDLPESLQQQIAESQEQAKLTQFLGLSLRSVLPYAESEANNLSEVARRDNDDEVQAESVIAERALQRARVALERLDGTSLSINELEDDALDDDFEITFEDDDQT